MKSRLAPAILLTIMGLVSFQMPAYADSPLNTLFPWLFGPPDEGPKPEDTLQAPFGDKPAAKKEKSELMEMYDEGRPKNNAVSLDQPHRNAEQVGDWVTGVVTQALTIDPNTFEKVSVDVAKNFTPYAQQEYKNFLSNRRILELLKNNNMKLTAFAETKPVLLQEGALEGSYRWLMRVPVMLTYYDRVTTTLKNNKKPIAQTQRVVVTMQIGRVQKRAVDGTDDILIERWTVSGN